MKESLSFWNTGYTAPKSKEQWKKETTSVKEDSRITSFHSQEDALRLLNSGKNVFLTGGAGTGKSYVLKKFVSLCLIIVATEDLQLLKIKNMRLEIHGT